MPTVVIGIPCPDCDNVLVKQVHMFSEGDSSVVDVILFEQTTWYCPECDKTWCIGDIDVVDREDLF